MATPKQEYIVSEVKRAILKINDYLVENGAIFTLPSEAQKSVKFVFKLETDKNGKPTPLNSLEFLIKEQVPDKYEAGRIAGRVYHAVHNPLFKYVSTKPETLHILRVVEHCFALLHLRADDPEYNLEDTLTDYSSAKDPPASYSFLNEIVDPMDKAKGNKISHIERAKLEHKKEIEAEQKRKKQDEEFKVSQYKDQEVHEELDVPELAAYEKYELPGANDPLSATLAKMRNESFNVAKTIIEGRGQTDNTWKKTIEHVILMDADTAKQYLSGILGY